MFAVYSNLLADNNGFKMNMQNSVDSVFTYPSMIRHDNRYSNNTRYLFEYTPNHDGLDEKTYAGLECVQDAVNTLPLSMPYYSYRYGYDTKIIVNMPNIAPNIGVVVFSHYLSEQALLSPSGGDTSAVLFLSSLLKKMCPLIVSRTTYRQVKTEKTFDYLVFQYKN
jgi:hypothetical protein